MADTEEYFPRGGKKPTGKYFKQGGNFLGATDKSEKKKKKPKKKSEGDDGYLSGDVDKEYEQSLRNCSVGLNSKTIKEGLLVLGRVQSRTDTKLLISLPSRMRASAMACHISQPYNKILEAYVNDQVASVRELRRMFRPGQYVAAKVLEVEEKSLMLTLMPQHVNSGMQLADIVNGTLLQAAVSSVEDHGFVMDLGIANARAFLPKDKVEEGHELDTGMLAWCVVKSVSVSAESSIVSLDGRVAALQSAVSRRVRNLPAITPGTAIEFTVDKALDTGIEGHILNNVTSYIQRSHTDRVKGKKPQLSQKIRARLLYQLPTRKTPFLTMKSIFENLTPDLNSEQRYKPGDFVENAQVINIKYRSVVFKLGKKNEGILSLKNVSADEDLEDRDVIAKNYPLGSTHRVRVMHYNLCDYNYTVSDKTQDLEEKYFSLDQLTVGMTVDATVTEVTDSKIVLQVGRMQGIVPKGHMTDSGVYVDQKRPTASKLSKKKYKIGQQVEARVLNLDLDTNGLVLTLKPSLLALTDILDSYTEESIGKSYTGVIKHIKDFLIVAFFNNVVAYVPKIFVSKQPIENFYQAFHCGQIVNCTILNVDPENKKMSGSLITPPFDPSNKRTKAVMQNKKRRNNSEASIDNTSKNDDKSKPKTKKRKRDKNSESNEDERDSGSEKEVKTIEQHSEESDAIETDIKEDFLTPQDLNLIDLTDCTTRTICKKRIVKLIKSVKTRLTRIDRIEAKIQKIENKGLNKKNKKFHTAMHAEQSIIKERVKVLIEALKNAQDLIKTFPEEDEPPIDLKSKKNKTINKIQNGDVNKENGAVKKQDGDEDKFKTNEEVIEKLKERVREVNSGVANALELPSVKEFWCENVVLKPEAKKDVESSSSDEEEQEQPKKKRKKLTAAEKVAKAREEEEHVRRLEMAALSQAPRSAPHYERALLAEPNSSELWLAYAALHLQSTEIEKARAVLRRALKTINFREEEEKFNVWMAIINMEHRFGTEETQQKTVEEALQMNDPIKVHTKLLDILVDLNKTTDLASLVDKMLRKYKRVADNYVQCGRACYTLGMLDKARQVMQKAMNVLEKKEHVTVLVQFALLERSHGERDRAEALFEQILGVYPQRVDVCSAYIDMLYKAGDHDQIRQVMERMTSHKLPARKMKVLYKKWIEVEEKIGDQDQIEKIRQKAMEFIDNAKF